VGTTFLGAVCLLVNCWTEGTTCFTLRNDTNDCIAELQIDEDDLSLTAGAGKTSEGIVLGSGKTGYSLTVFTVACDTVIRKSGYLELDADKRCVVEKVDGNYNYHWEDGLE
jgi:hypothetical protein